MKKNKPIEERKKLLEEYRKSGLSKSRFSREKKIPLPTFYSWFRLEKQKNKNKFNFIPLSIEESSQETTPSKNQILDKIILKTLSGVALELPTSISISWLSSLLKELA